MPKRVVHGEALYRSDKLAKVQPVRYRSEYANILPLATANGTFEADPLKVWCQVYSYNRPDVTPQDAEQMLAEFERVKMLFRWREPDGKLWGFFIGIDKPGRLPGPSRQGKNEAVGPKPPMDSIRKFLDSTECSTESTPGNKKHLGFGLGSGSGLGSGKTLPAPQSENDCDGKGIGTSDIAPPERASSNGKVKSTPLGKNKLGGASPAGQRLAALLRGEILRNKPDVKITNKQLADWALVADRMIRLDKRSEERIAAVIRWSQADDFWMSNALSMNTIREKFDQLELKSRAGDRRDGSCRVGVHEPNKPEPQFKVKIPLGLNHAAAKRRWSEFLAQMPRRIGEHSFTTWLQPSKPLGIRRGVLYVRVPAAEFSETIPRKFGGELAELLPDLKIELRVPTEVHHA